MYWRNSVNQPVHKRSNLFSITEIAAAVKGKIEGNPKLRIKGVCDIQDSKSGYISYVLPGKYENYFKTTKATALLTNKSLKINRKNKTLIRVTNPALSFIDIIHMFYPDKPNNGEIHPSAIIAENVKLGTDVGISPYVVIDHGVNIGNSVQIGAGSFIGSNTKIGNGSIISSNVSIYHDITIGNNCIIDAGTVIGADGFGLVTYNGTHHKMPHVGSVNIKNNVWIGSNCCIDRGTLGNTMIDEGSKLDNHIQIAHNVKIGKKCRISGQTAIAGSTIIENNVTVAGQVGIIDHLTIGKDSTVASKSAVYKSLEAGSFVSGIPARSHKNRLRQDIIINQLPDIMNRLRNIEKKLSIKGMFYEK